MDALEGTRAVCWVRGGSLNLTCTFYVETKTVFLLFKNCPSKLDISDYCIVLVSGAASFKLSIA